MRWTFICLPADTLDISPQIKGNTKPEIIEKNNEASSFAWQAEKPGAFKQALEKASGLSSRFVSFLAQNIGWFISCFFFVTGSLFLVSYTAEFMRSLVISVILFTYTLLMLTGAYQIRRKRPDLYITSRVLTALGMLLIPLCIAASVRLTDFSITAGLVMCLINMGVFYWLAQLASGITDRSLHGKHPRIFMYLAAVQLAVPLVNAFPLLPVIGFFHSAVLILLVYGTYGFVNQWLKSIFIERNNTAWYAAGTLVYAASVSFVHLTLSYGPSLPDAYPGPFLMILSGLLFYLDFKIKQFNREHAFLSRLTFGIYGLSIFALGVSFGSYPAMLISLVLGSWVYGAMVWYYLTIIPLWLFLGCISWLYYLVILIYVPDQAYFITSIPGLACLLGVQKYTVKRGAASLGLLVFRARGLIAFALAFYSFWYAVPGITGFLTGIAITGFIYATLRWPALQIYGGLNLNKKLALLIESGKDLRDIRLFYAVPFLSLVSLFYAPVIIFNQPGQFSSGLMLLSLIWTFSGLGLFKKQKLVSGIRISVFLNSAIICIFSSLLIILTQIPHYLEAVFLIPALCLGSLLLIWQSLVLRTSFTFYTFLALSAWAGALIKRTWFPGLSAGMIEMFISLGLFALTWKLERIKNLNAQFKQELEFLADSGANIKLLGIYPVYFRPIYEMMLKPLNQAMIILWAFALFKTGRYLTIEGLTLVLILNAFAGTFLTLLLGMRYGLFNLVYIPVLMGSGSLLAVIYKISGTNIHLLNFSAVLYALAIWLISLKILSNQVFSQVIAMINHSSKLPENEKIIRRINQAAYSIIVVFSALSLFSWLFNPETAVLTCMGPALIFMYISAKYYKKIGFCYDFMALTVLSALVVHVKLFSISLPFFLIADYKTGVLFSLMSLGMAALKWYSKGIYRKPLEKTSAFLALAAGIQALILIPLAQGFNFINVLNLVVSGAALLAVSHDIKSHLLRVSGIFLISFSLFCTGTWLSHTGQIFFLWPAGRGGWITMAVLSLGLAVLSRYSRISDLYTVPIRRIALLGYGISLAKALPLLLTVSTEIKSEIFVPCFFLILSLGLFPITPSFPKGAKLRGAGLLVFVTGIAVSLLSLTGLDIRNIVFCLVWPFIVLFLACYAVPFFNGVYPKWTIDSSFWPNAGFMLMLVSPILFSDMDIYINGFFWTALSIYIFMSSFMFKTAVGSLIAGLVLFLYPALSLPLSLTICTAVLFMIICILKNYKAFPGWKLYMAISGWLFIMPWISMISLLIFPVKSMAETVIITALLAVITAGIGWKDNQLFFFRVSKLLSLILLHIWPVIFIPSKKGAAFALWQIWPLIISKFNELQVLLPWYSLQLAAAAWGIIGLRGVIKKGLGERFPVLNKIRPRISFISWLAFMEWTAHIFVIIINSDHLNSPYASIHAAGAVFSAVLMIMLGIREVVKTQKPVWVYAVFFITGLSGLYLRFLWIGFSPAGIWDSAAILIFSGFMFICHHLTKIPVLSVSLLRMTIVLPLLSLPAVPWHIGSVHAGAVLLGTGLIYLSIYYTTGRSLFMYMSAVIMNSAVYLWVPVWAENTRLLHLYTVPVAMSVLVLLHLHKKELKRSVLNKARLTAICVLYASAGLDVFLRQELFVFILAVGLGLAGIISGIGMQIRAFLYGGLIFVVMNVMGQLLRFYPDGRLEKGIILVTLGSLIMIGMIWFNIRREDILSRIRIFRADLAEWE
ncbi:Uncharacterized protein dnl_08920 [Desulfonema limicola]|uniref:Uncharacterized protein n=1 Tax=Desulfonema limicola TaxID=45656 RepID=A0A975B4J7_9BACT|nr:hypothetical protein [Desulfonema limicola]QTA78664.1 Uncharacterized protein dnl_08920 [Desulfonema limicola]